MAIAGGLVLVYCIIFLGGFSPVHFRFLTAIVGMSTVIISITAGYGAGFAIGLKVSRFNDVLPFMILGIGADDIFVIVNTIDQTPQHLSANERFKRGLKHAGPSITIASLTTALSFLCGSASSLPVIKSVCQFACIVMIIMYMAFFVLFSPFYLNDLQRMHNLKGDCFGLCCCAPDTILCCGGKLLNKTQRKFVGLPVLEKTHQKENDKEA